jgi:hypothetical protein
LVGLYDFAERVYVEGPFAEIAVPATRERRFADVPKVGDVLAVKRPRSLVVAEFGSRGAANELRSPPLVKEILDAGDYTGIVLGTGTVVVTRDVEVSGREGRPVTIWCRVAPCDDFSDACAEARRNLEKRNP